MQVTGGPGCPWEMGRVSTEHLRTQDKIWCPDLTGQASSSPGHILGEKLAKMLLQLCSLQASQSNREGRERQKGTNSGPWTMGFLSLAPSFFFFFRSFRVKFKAL